MRTLRKPSVAAWAVNLLVRRATAQVEQVLDVGAALRQAQEGMDAGELRTLTKQRRQLTAALTQQARGLAAEEGVKITPAVADQVEATLTAAMVSSSCGEAVRSGMLVASLATTGMDVVEVGAAVALPQALGYTATARTPEPPPRPDLRVVPDPDADAKAREAAEAELAEAEEALIAARAVVDEADAAVETVRARQLQVEAEIDELRRRIADLEDTYDETEEELALAEEEASSAAVALAEATSARDSARTRLR